MSKITVLWDIMLDKFSYWSVKKLNPESPAPLLNIEKEEYKLWWAANVAANVSALDERSELIGVLWKDINATIFEELCKESNIKLEKITSSSPTITKQRFIETSYQQQLIRADYESKISLSASDEEIILDHIKKEKPEYLIISDYLKGTISENLVSQLKKQIEHIFVDTKPQNIELFKDVFLIKPNFKEFCQIINQEIKNTNENIEHYGKIFTKKHRTNLVVTRWSQWASLITKEWKVIHVPTEAKQVFDVTGAWDTFLAAITVALKKWKTLEEAVILGNKASGIVVGKVGTAVVNKEDLTI